MSWFLIYFCLCFGFYNKVKIKVKLHCCYFGNTFIICYVDRNNCKFMICPLKPTTLVCFLFKYNIKKCQDNYLFIMNFLVCDSFYERPTRAVWAEYTPRLAGRHFLESNLNGIVCAVIKYFITYLAPAPLSRYPPAAQRPHIKVIKKGCLIYPLKQFTYLRSTRRWII